MLVPVVMQESTFYGPLTCTGNTGTFNQFSCFFQEQKSFFMIKLVIFGILHLIIFHTRLCKFFFAVKYKVFTGKINVDIFYILYFLFYNFFLTEIKSKRYFYSCIFLLFTVVNLIFFFTSLDLFITSVN